jgi:hypothetical protein
MEYPKFDGMKMVLPDPELKGYIANVGKYGECVVIDCNPRGCTYDS